MPYVIKASVAYPWMIARDGETGWTTDPALATVFHSDVLLDKVILWHWDARRGADRRWPSAPSAQDAAVIADDLFGFLMLESRRILSPTSDVSHLVRVKVLRPYLRFQPTGKVSNRWSVWLNQSVSFDDPDLAGVARATAFRPPYARALDALGVRLDVVDYAQEMLCPSS